MKKYSFLVIYNILAITLLFFSCTRDQKKTAADDRLVKIDVEIPLSLKGNPEVVNYIHDMNKIADDYALLIDQVLSDFSGYEHKDLDNMGMMDKIKFMKVSAEVGFKSIDIMSKWGEYHNKVDLFKNDLNEDETKALESVLKRFEERMKQIENKHAKFFKD